MVVLVVISGNELILGMSSIKMLKRIGPSIDRVQCKNKSHSTRAAASTAIKENLFRVEDIIWTVGCSNVQTFAKFYDKSIDSSSTTSDVLFNTTPTNSYCSILTSITETSSISRVVSYGADPFSVPLSG